MKKIINNPSIFRLTYIICLFFLNIAFVQIGAYVFLAVLVIWGVYLTIRNIFINKQYRELRFGGWLILFIAANVITLLINILSNSYINLIFIAHMCICFFIFYGMHTEKNFNFRKELYTFCRFMVYATTIIATIGLLLLMFRFYGKFMHTNLVIYENRFTALYVNPNLAGLSSVVAVICCHMLTKKNFIRLSEQSRISRIWMVACVIINIMTLFLCDSNASMVLFLGYCMIYVIYIFFNARHKFKVKQMLIRFGSTILVGVIIVSASYAMRDFCQLGVAAYMNMGTSTEGLTKEEIEELTGDQLITFDHENKNLDSGRTTLLEQALIMYGDNPVFGIGKGNIFSYSYNYFEKGMHFSKKYVRIAPKQFRDIVGTFSTDIHNGYMTILLSSGAIGFLLFAIFGIRYGTKLLSLLLKTQDRLENTVFPCIFAFLLAYLAYAFFEKALMFDMSFMVVIFWMFLGYSSMFFKKYFRLSDCKDLSTKDRIRKILL